MSEILSGIELRDSKIPEQKKRVEELLKIGKIPSLAIVTVGDDSASKMYVRNKKKLAEEIGISVHHEVLSSDCTQSQLNHILETFSDMFHGVILQIPLPRHLDADEAMLYISYHQDVDGFLPNSPYIQCTAKGVVELLHKSIDTFSGKSAVVIGRSTKVGLPIALALLRENMTVTICHSKTNEDDMRSIMSYADVVVSCIGKAKHLKWEWTNPKCIIIDVGMNRDEKGKLCGDFDMNGIEKTKQRIYTPVPGGVGPMTVSCLMDNVIEATERSKN